MNATVTSVIAVGLIAIGLLAELNLLRLFLADWRESRREDRARRPAPRRAEASPTADRRPLLGWLAASLAIPALGAAAHAQEPAATQPQTPVEQPETAGRHLVRAAESPFSLQLNLDYTTAYFYHGIIQEDTGLILQPAAKLTINLYKDEDFKIDALLGTWNSFHGQKTGSQTRGDFTEYWYESDLLGGVALTTGSFSLTTQYVFLTSPSDAYETVQELDFTFAYDDSEALGKFALHPYAMMAIETGADASDGADSDTGTYLELGIAPGFSVDLGETPVAVSFPVSVGLSLDNYYQDASGNDEAFGFAQVGVKASVPLPFGERYGKWTLNAGVAALFLGDNTEVYNADDDSEILATLGVQLNF